MCCDDDEERHVWVAVREAVDAYRAEAGAGADGFDWGEELLEGDRLGMISRKWWALQRWCDGAELVARMVEVRESGRWARWDDALARCVSERSPTGLVVVDVRGDGVVGARVGVLARATIGQVPPVGLLVVMEEAGTIEVAGKAIELPEGATLLDVDVSHGCPTVELATASHRVDLPMVEPADSAYLRLEATGPRRWRVVDDRDVGW